MAETRYYSGASSCFKAYDIRGVVPDEIDEELAFKLGASCKDVFDAQTVVLGRDARLSSESLANALAAGLAETGISVSTLGLCGTEEIYHAAGTGDFDLGIMITGSHNPANQNGFKLVKRGAIPVCESSGLNDLAREISRCGYKYSGKTCQTQPIRVRDDYLRWLLDYVSVNQDGKSLRVVVNAGNGCAGPMVNELKQHLPFDFIPVQFEPDGNFPNGVPNPLLPERRLFTSQAVKETCADLGVAFDGDFDRCFFYDENGKFIESYYLVGLLASSLLCERPGEKIIHDPRLYWNTQEMVLNAGGLPVMGRAGHAFMKEKMRSENALYGGEMSAHHYFRDFAYCDSGMLTMLLILKLVQDSQKTLGEMAADRMAKFPCSGELNFRVEDAKRKMDEIWNEFSPECLARDELDGINMEFRDWRFNLRPSNTEPLLRLNVETRGNMALLADMTQKLTNRLK